MSNSRKARPSRIRRFEIPELRETGTPMMCAVCHQRIHILILDGVSSWGHRESATNNDHSPRPVPADATAENVCDFCSEPDPVWVFPTNPTMGAWSACEPCRTLVTAGAREQLVERCYQVLAAHPNLTDLTSEEARLFVADVHQSFWEATSGPGTARNPD